MGHVGPCPYSSRGVQADHGGVQTRHVAATTALVIVLAEGTVSLVAGIASPLTWPQLMNGFVVSNTILGLSFALAGYPIARARPDNLVGWLLLGAGTSYVFSGAGYAVLAWHDVAGESAPGWRLLADLTSTAWPLAVACFIPLTLLFFPDGRLLSSRWRVAVPVCLVGTLLFEVGVALGPTDTTSELGVNGFLRWPWADHRPVLFLTGGVLVYGVLMAALVSLVLHFWRGDELRRRQVLWLLLAAVVMVAAFVVSDLGHFESWFFIFVIALLPMSVAVAILRHQLLDIRLVASRSILYLGMTGLVAAAYVGIVAGTDRALSARTPLGPPVLATMAIAVAFNPVRKFLQTLTDHAFYGTRRDPVRTVAAIGSRLGETGLDGVLEGLCTSLRYPWAVIEVEGVVVAAFGQKGGPAHLLTLPTDGAVAQVALGLRRGEQTLGHKDEEVLALVTGSLAVAVQSTRYAQELMTARNALVTAREEERRRLGRDLHDGIGPVLTGVTMKADAARRVVATDREAAAVLLGELRLQASMAVEEVRRLAQQLRPPVLDSLGLVGALEQHATSMAPLEVRVDGSLPSLPAAVEVAAYRIALEALTNVVRHSSATCAVIRLDGCDESLRLVVTDNGRAVNGGWRTGTGLSSMRERALELGGTMDAGPGSAGGRVEVLLPCGGTP
jgi:two-component system, NarL family, sensor kinase